MTLLLSAVVSAVATALGRTSEEAEKAVQVAMTAMTQTVAALKGRKLDASKPKQSSTPLPATTTKQSRPINSNSVNGRLTSGDTPCETPASLPDQTVTVQQMPLIQAEPAQPRSGPLARSGSSSGVPQNFEEVVRSTINEDLYMSDATSTGASEAGDVSDISDSE